MRVLLISLNREREPFTAAPLGLALVSASLVKAGHEVEVLDLLFADDPESELDRAVSGFGPGMVGVSIRNVESSTEFLLPGYKKVVAHLQGLTDAPLVAGGPGFSVMPRQALEYLGLKYGVVGEGEAAAVGAADAVAAGETPAAVPGVCSLGNGGYSFNPAPPLELDGLATPAWGLIPKGYDMTGVQSKRGCSFGCVYCTYPALEGRRMRLRPPEEVAREMQAALECGAGPSFYFVDNVFNNPRRHAEEVCRAVAGRGLDVSWGCLASPKGLDEGLVGLMARAGCESVEIGADSLSGGMLKRLGKAFTAEEAGSAIRACKAAGMAHMVFLILGGPGEDRDTLRETFDALESLSPDKVFAVSGIRIYPETPLASIAVEEGLIGPGDGLLEPAFYVSRGLGDELYGMSEEFFARHAGWIYYPVDGSARPKEAKTPPAPGRGMSWEAHASRCMDEVISSVPRLLRPIARKAVAKKACALASVRGLASVGATEVRDAFLSETPGPFQGPMKEGLRKLGLI